MSIIKQCILLSIVCIMVFGCSSVAKSSYTDRELEVIDNFFSQPLNQRIKLFNDYSEDDRYLLYIHGSQEVHPPAIYLATEYAKGGKKVADYLHGKLRTTDDDMAVRDIILVYAEMASSGIYKASSDADLLELITSKINSMEDNEWKWMTEDLLPEL